MNKEDRLSVVGTLEQTRIKTEMAQATALSGIWEAIARHEETARRTVLLTFLYLFPVLVAMQPIIDPDIWWHLRTGQWIIEHGTVPIIDPFSSYGAGKPWIAYSWLFEVLVYGLHQAFGLVGIILYTVVCSLLITAALYALIRKLVSHFPSEIALTAASLCAIAPLLNPRPWLLTILFFTIEMNLLLTARQSGDTRRLLLLPPLFALWANIHIQFIYGLFVLGLVTIEPIIDRILGRSSCASEEKTLPFNRMLLITAVCIVATLATPYHFFLFRAIIELITQTGAFQYISELTAPSFRVLPDWFVLALTLSAVFSLGWRRETRPFPLLLLATGTFLAFRARRDVWFAIVAAVTLIAMSRSNGTVVTADRFALTRVRTLFIAGAVVTALVLIARTRHISGPDLQSALAKKFPAAAVAVVKERGFTGPLYNHFDWGGYFIWRLPHLPVSMDGRTNVHGDERIDRSIATWAGKNGWASDSELTNARLVIAGVNQALASLLRLDSRFELVYEDKIAAVFVARSSTGKSLIAPTH